MTHVVDSVTGENIPVGKIVCLGRNYAEHAKEMKGEVPKAPVIFLKPSTCLLREGNICLPEMSKDVHEELELGVVIGKGGSSIPLDQAMDHIRGYLLFLDITARDLQWEAKKKGMPWSVSKGFDTFGPVSKMAPKEKIEDPHKLNMELKVNGETRQKDSTSNMVFRIDRLIEYISYIMTLEPGDIIATGTPKGVSQIISGDIIEAEIELVASVTFNVH